VGLRAGLDAETGRKILCLSRASNPAVQSPYHILYCLSYPGYLSGRGLLETVGINRMIILIKMLMKW
jgi:hypothetical protein